MCLIFQRYFNPSKHTTWLQRRCNVTTLQRYCNDAVATLCACWAQQTHNVVTTKLQRHDVVTTLLRRCVLAGMVPCHTFSVHLSNVLHSIAQPEHLHNLSKIFAGHILHNKSAKVLHADNVNKSNSLDPAETPQLYLNSEAFRVFPYKTDIRSFGFRMVPYLTNGFEPIVVVFCSSFSKKQFQI